MSGFSGGRVESIANPNRHGGGFGGARCLGVSTAARQPPEENTTERQKRRPPNVNEHRTSQNKRRSDARTSPEVQPRGVAASACTAEHEPNRPAPPPRTKLKAAGGARSSRCASSSIETSFDSACARFYKSPTMPRTGAARAPGARPLLAASGINSPRSGLLKGTWALIHQRARSLATTPRP